MLFTKTEIKVLELLVSRVLDSFTIREISRLTGKDLKIVHTAVKNLASNNFLIKEKNGLRIDYRKHIQDLAYIEGLRKEQFFKRHLLLKAHINNFTEKNPEKFCILIIFGSYAAGKETRRSDIDLLAILPSKDDNFNRRLKAALSISSHPYHIETIGESSFREMMQQRDEMNIINETLNNHILLYGAEQYFGLLGERDVR